MRKDRGRLQGEAAAPLAVATEALRPNYELLATLVRIQGRFIADADAAAAFAGLLETLLTSTGSECGFIGEVLGNELHQANLKTHAVTGLESDQVNALLAAVTQTGQPVVATEPRTFLGLPLYRGQELIGVACAANRPAGYDAGLVPFLEPLAQVCATLIAAHRAQREGRQRDEESEQLRAQ